MLDSDLIDCWRKDHMEDRKYTWLKKNPVKQARLDFFLISNTIYSKVDKTDILPGYRTDHSLTFLSVVLDKNIDKGYSNWKFNNSLLRDTRYINKIKLLINIIKVQYACEDQFENVSIENIDNKDIRLVIDDKLFSRHF